MKHLKTYENLNYHKFWLIRTDEPYFLFGLKKLHSTPKQINYFLQNKNIAEEKKIYIRLDDFGMWANFPYGKKFYNDMGYTYQGEVQFTPEEIEECELIKTTKKYNL
jgi:hypothetical protein